MTTDQDAQALQELLPWLANDTLQGDEQKRAADYASETTEGRRQLRQWRALSKQISDEPYDKQGEDLAWARLSRALDRQTDQPANQIANAATSTEAKASPPPGRISPWARPITRGQLAASFAGIAALGLIIALTIAPMPQPAKTFTTLSSPDTTPGLPSTGDEVTLRLALAPGLTIDSGELDAYLRARDADLLSHSAQTGVVMIRVPRRSPFSDPARWQQETVVVFAEQLK